MEDKALLSAKEMATRLGVHIGTILDWVKHNKIPHYKLGKVLRFRHLEIDAWMATKTKPLND